ncbi:MAG: hypothetical protein JJE30_08305 [Desulfuromonadales bacterium]|nr:hypothetical protein [Desulfuromonadales bacterium]
MVLGYNHNIVYKGEIFHVQTEDSGVNNPHIITLLYRGGVILCSKKTSYADILMMENLESVVEELMKAQHKELMRRLKSGEFDERAFSINAPLLENYAIPALEPEEVPGARRIDDIFVSAVSRPDSATSDISLLFDMPVTKAAPVTPAAPQPAEKPAKDVVNIDDAILNFFGANVKK